MFKERSLLLPKLVGGFFVALTVLSSAQAQTKANTSDQLYIEVSALGSLDYFYDHKMGLQEGLAKPWA